METLSLPVTSKAYATAKAAREADRVPMVYYGKGIKNQNFSADYQEFRRAFLKGGRSTIITLVSEDKKEYPVLVHDFQQDPVTDRIIHVDVLAVDMNKAIHTRIPLVFTGVAPAVKDLGGTVVHSRNYIEASCLPKDLVHQIEVDISLLKDFHSSITVGQLALPPGIKVLDNPGINVVSATAPRKEEEVAPVAAVPGAEGAAAPAEGAAAPAEGAAAAAPAAGKAEKGDKKKA